MRLPQITSASEDGFHDLVFALTDQRRAERLLCRYLADLAERVRGRSDPASSRPSWTCWI
ncbi:MAG: hypothetical protein KF718_24645 [Polyangiaceae bacterium]|nr:hypothetical protein [Polyangiaceae bacterium]